MNKIEGFDRMVIPLLNWLEKPENKDGELFEGNKYYTYSQMAQLIREGNGIGIDWATNFIEEERKIVNEIKNKIF